MKKHVNLIATSLLSTGLVLGGVGSVMVSQNQDVVKAAQTETQISQAHQNAIKKADAGVKKAVSAKVRRKSRRTVNKYEIGRAHV